MTPAIAGWHPGEVQMHQELGFADAMQDRWTIIASTMSDQHRLFYTSNVPFIPTTTIDEYGRPWGSILAGANGSFNFVESPNNDTLIIHARFWDGDPMLQTIKAFLNQPSCSVRDRTRFLIAGIGVEHSTRRRNKFAGYIKSALPVEGSANTYKLHLTVNQALGNCPKYINVRALKPHDGHPAPTVLENLSMKASDKLPDEIIKLVTSADTAFLASYYRPTDPTLGSQSSHAGMNIRAGLPGFIRVDLSDRRTIVLPDYSGNRIMSSLGNIRLTSMAGLTIIDFYTGDVLYLTGRAKVLTGQSAQDIMARQSCLTTIEVTGYILAREAIPIRQDPSTPTERSPYSPKIKYLTSETGGPSAGLGSEPKAQLVQGTSHSDDIATFRFKIISTPSPSEKLRILPGQAIVLDFMDWMGPPTYSHMANDKPGSINDDRVRTWTVSSAHEDNVVTWFDLTMRKVKLGAVTGALFDILRRVGQQRPAESVDLSAENVYADVVGTTGSFHMKRKGHRMLWVAGGIGVTPFLSMLTAISRAQTNAKTSITLVLATREPDVLLKLINHSYPKALPNVHIVIDVFTSRGNMLMADSPGLQHLHVNFYNYRIPQSYWTQSCDYDEIFICGPEELENTAYEGLKGVGIPDRKIYREGFY